MGFLIVLLIIIVVIALTSIKVVNQSEVLAPTFIERGAMTETKYGDSSIRVLDLKKVYDLVIEEMINHDGQGLSRHDI